MKVLKSLTFGVMSRGSQNPVLAMNGWSHADERRQCFGQVTVTVVTASARGVRGDKLNVRFWP